MEVCKISFLEVTGTSEVPPLIANGIIPQAQLNLVKRDNKLWEKRDYTYKRINLIGTTRYQNLFNMNAGLGEFGVVLE